MKNYHNITKAEIKMDGGLKTLFIEWDDGEKNVIWGSCLDKIKEVLTCGIDLESDPFLQILKKTPEGYWDDEE